MSLCYWRAPNRRKKSNAVNVTPNGDFGYWLDYYPMPDGIQLAHFVPSEEEHPLEPGACECGCELKNGDGGYYVLHKRDLKYVVVPDYLPLEL